MKKEITMEAVFAAGFTAGFKAADDMSEADSGSLMAPELTGQRIIKRNTAWLEYVKELENG